MHTLWWLGKGIQGEALTYKSRCSSRDEWLDLRRECAHQDAPKPNANQVDSQIVECRH
jgi:hypothetical protein